MDWKGRIATVCQHTFHQLFISVLAYFQILWYIVVIGVVITAVWIQLFRKFRRNGGEIPIVLRSGFLKKRLMVNHGSTGNFGSFVHGLQSSFDPISSQLLLPPASVEELAFGTKILNNEIAGRCENEKHLLFGGVIIRLQDVLHFFLFTFGYQLVIVTTKTNTFQRVECSANYFE